MTVIRDDFSEWYYFGVSAPLCGKQSGSRRKPKEKFGETFYRISLILKTENLDHPFADGVRSSYSTKTNKYWVLLDHQIWASNSNWKWMKMNIQIPSLAKLLSRLPDCLPQLRASADKIVRHVASTKTKSIKVNISLWEILLNAPL